MIVQGLVNSSQKNSSGEINISTAQSLHIKNTCKQNIEKNSSLQNLSGKRSLPKLQLNELNEIHTSNPITQEDSQISSRLFTFMDEKEAERKIIQDYVFRHSFKKRGQDEQENKKSQVNIGLIQMIQDSRKKREDFFKKIAVNPTVIKNKSVSKINKTNRSRTPRNTQTKYQTLQPRSRSKTPKFQVKYNTPKHQFEPKLFRAKSNLGREKLKVNETKINKAGRESVIPKKSNEEDNQNYRELLHEKNLWKKKKQLEKQLNAINGSLLELKRAENCKKKNKNGVKALQKKSKSKVGRL